MSTDTLDNRRSDSTQEDVEGHEGVTDAGALSQKALAEFGRQRREHITHNPIRRIRDQYGIVDDKGKLRPMSQQQLAYVIGVVALTIQNWEHGSVKPSYNGFHQIAMAFIRGEHEPPQPPPNEPERMSPEYVAYLETPEGKELTAKRDQWTKQLLHEWQLWFDARPHPPAFVLPTPPFLNDETEVED